MTESERAEILRGYVDGERSAERTADRLGPGVCVADVILETKARFGRLPDRDDAFTQGEYRRALALLGLDDL